MLVDNFLRLDGKSPVAGLYIYLFVFLQYGLPMPIALLRADNNLPPWRSGLKEVKFPLFLLQMIVGKFSRL